MYSMLIVDDEEITREGLRTLPLWAAMGVRVVGCAENGEDALAQLASLPVSILLTDVKMPCMDGLTLCEHVRQLYPHMRIVFVSGYDDVSYIRRALRMSAVDYILKPIDQHELAQCFRRVIDALDCERDRQGELAQLLTAYQAGMTFMQENLLGILLTSKTVSEGDLRQVAQVLHTGHENYRYFAAAIRIAFPEGISIHAVLAGMEGVYAFPVDQQSGVYAVLFMSPHALSAAERHALLSDLRDALRRQGARRIFAAYENKQGGIWDVRTLLECALAALPSCFSMEDGALLSCQSAVPPLRSIPPVSEPDADTLEHLFLSGSQEEADRYLDALFAALRAARLTCAADYIPLLSPLLRALDDLLRRRFTLREDDGMDFSQQLGALASAFCLDDMLDGVRRHYQGVRSMLLYHCMGETPARIARVKRYVQTHYAQSISLDRLAREVNLAPTYLCLLFREETGQTLNAYITAVRMERARALLADMDLKLYDVSLAVGYPNPSYFTRQFRKHTGMTPTEYRNRCIKGE